MIIALIKRIAMSRRKTRTVRVGKVKIGSSFPISVQSMAKTDTRDVKATVRQIKGLQRVGCEIVRVAVPDKEAARCLKEIKGSIDIPLVADIHFNYRLALASIDAGVDGLRLNPGNIHRKNEVKEVVRRAKKRRIPIRIGVNSGSLPKSPKRLSSRMVKCACDYMKIFEDLNFQEIIISLKASDVPSTIEAYRLMAERSSYPFHLGITASGPPSSGSILSAVGIGTLLSQGIGDTIRVSLTGDPEGEVRVAYEILKSLGLRERGPILISCPTCGRCEVNLINIVKRVEKRLTTHYPQLTALKVAIMGCEVNGPGEARDADIGIAAGKGVGLLFKKGKVVRKVKEKELVKVLLQEIENALE